MSAWLHQQRYALSMSFLRMRRQPFSSIANIIIMALVLSIPLIAASALVALKPVTVQITTASEISVYLKGSIPEGSVQSIAQRIQLENPSLIKSAQIITREQAYESFKNDATYKEVLSVIEGNPLPDAIILSLSSASLSQAATDLANQLRTWPEIDNVQLNQVWMERLSAILRFLQTSVTFLGIAVLLTLFASVFNTVRIQALSQQKEIRVARLVGATESFIRRPFLYLGAISCGIAGIFSIAISAGILFTLNLALVDLAHSYQAAFMLHLPSWDVLLSFVIACSLLGAVAARCSVTRTA